MTQQRASSDSIFTGTIDELAQGVLRSGGDEAQAYLRASFLTSAALSLWHARQDAGLTQTEVARRMETTQSAIARMEKDTAGTMSLHRYVDYLLACGKIPFDIELASIARARAFTEAEPDCPATAAAVREWEASAASAGTSGPPFRPNVPAATAQTEEVV